jgi:tRNA nucleotidyltransferase (CCA-adding enzyme)
MKIILGHSNLDLDCIGSMVLARYLYPDHQPVSSRFIHPVARNLFNLYSHHLDFLPSQDLAGATVDHVVVVDTRSSKRVQEYFEKIGEYRGGIEVYDHHPSDDFDIKDAVIHANDYGANVTFFALELASRGIVPGPDDATIALAGIFADTGNFTHDNVKKEDFAAAEFLIANRASVGMVRRLLGSLKEDHQISLFHQLLNDIIYQDFHGHIVALGIVELDCQVPGLAAVVEKAFEVENVDAIFAVFSFRKENDVLIIARSQRERIDARGLMAKFGGSGHAQASSALVRDRSGGDVFRELLNHIHEGLVPAVTAGQIMTRNFLSIGQDWSLLEASKYLEEIDHTGAPVIDGEGRMTGFISLRNIMKGRKGGKMSSPVRAYMVKNVITAGPDATIRSIEDLFFKNNIGHLPILENGRMVGLVTRADYLGYIDGGKTKTDVRAISS